MSTLLNRRAAMGLAVGGAAASALTASAFAQTRGLTGPEPTRLAFGSELEGPGQRRLRTPEAAFADVDFPYEPRYTNSLSGASSLGFARIAHYEAGPSDGEPIILMHGNPSWAYLYRKMIPVFVDAGYRVLVPDLFGLGRSDKMKPEFAELYTYANIELVMNDWLQAIYTNGFIRNRPNLFVQDWGGLIGLRLFATQPDRFRRVVASNTALPSGAPGQPVSDAFLTWRTISQDPAIVPSPAFALQGGTVSMLDGAALGAYNAPHPSEDFLVALRRLASLVPITPDQDGAARNEKLLGVLSTQTVPFLTLFGDSDDLTRGWETIFQDLIPGAAGQPHEVIPNAGYFIQEDAGVVLAEKTIAWFRSTPA